ncbi:hypothetical protein L6164_031387 [Bauhinia variegata]|uniref:Uncharacterized protein n=1 Tax=Bauhinia variegata TaxID=167791 RepID=A0ACB9LEV2_BAUVA|nr:hypothetical protein L6164_031387 [Bauhinia variegata]
MVFVHYCLAFAIIKPLHLPLENLFSPASILLLVFSFLKIQSMAEQIPYGVAQSIINRLGSLAFRKIGMSYGVKSELEKLQETLESIKVVLSDAE